MQHVRITQEMLRARRLGTRALGGRHERRRRACPSPSGRRASRAEVSERCRRLREAPTSANGTGRAPSRSRKEWLPEALLWFVTTLLIGAHQGTVLTLAFPVLAILTGLWLYFKSPARYIGFMWWLWFLSPEVRRLADWSKGSFTPTSLIQVAPLAVTMISALSLLRYYKLLAQRRGLPVLLILLGLVYAFLVGVMSSGPLAATYDLANWLYPILIGFHIMANTRQYPQYRDTIVNTFIWGMLVMGGYGLVQFFIMPQWDALWMLGSQMNSQGDPVPMGVRVFSTMNSSGPFAFAMMGAMVFVMAATHRVRWVARGARFLRVRVEPRALDVGRLGHRAADPARQVEQQGAGAHRRERGAAGGAMRAAAGGRSGGRADAGAPDHHRQPERRPELRRA